LSEALASCEQRRAEQQQVQVNDSHPHHERALLLSKARRM
jgi:hypothetical protein